MSDLATLHCAQRALAEEIKANPDKSWRDSLMKRYTAFIRRNGPDLSIEPMETWREGAEELTEAILRSMGYSHQQQQQR